MLKYTIAIFAISVLLPMGTSAQGPAKEAPANYKDHVLPILQKNCLNCHNADKPTSELNVATYRDLMAGGASGDAIKPGSPDQSLLYKLVTHQSEPKMPPKGPKLADADLTTIKKW